MLTKGEGRRLGDASIRLLECGEGWPMGWSGLNGPVTWAGFRENGRRLQEGMGNGLQNSFLDLNQGFEFEDSNTKFELRPN
jgi:hypothetical protein